MDFPDVDALRKQVSKINDEEIRAAFWIQQHPGITEDEGLKAWGLFTEAEHFRAGLATVSPDETVWPVDHRQVLADLEKIADAFADTLFPKITGYGGVAPAHYPIRSR